jgi:hypothetical protein
LVTPAAPRIDSRLVAALERLDEPSRPMADTWRRVGLVARELGLVRPSYEQVRVLVHEFRRRGRRPTAGDVLLDVAFRVRPPTAILDHLAGIGPPSARR